MTLLERQSPSIADAPGEAPKPHWFSREDYFQLSALGFFEKGRVERIEGRILDMSPQNNPHFLSVSLIYKALEKVFAGDFWVRSQGPLQFGAGSDPEPDAAVVIGAMRTHHETPSSAILVVEVSDTTLRFDRGVKASLYAKYGIQEYWIVNLNARSVEVMREPVEDAGSPLGWRYASVTVFKAGQSVSPLAMAAAIAVADLLP